MCDYINNKILKAVVKKVYSEEILDSVFTTSTDKIFTIEPINSLVEQFIDAKRKDPEFILTTQENVNKIKDMLGLPHSHKDLEIRDVKVVTLDQIIVLKGGMNGTYTRAVGNKRG